MIPSRVGCHISSVCFLLYFYACDWWDWFVKKLKLMTHFGKQKMLSENTFVIEGPVFFVYSCIKPWGCLTLRVDCICHCQTGHVSIKVTEACHVCCVSWFLYLNWRFLECFCQCTVCLYSFICLLFAHLGNFVQHITADSWNTNLWGSWQSLS